MNTPDQNPKLQGWAESTVPAIPQLPNDATAKATGRAIGVEATAKAVRNLGCANGWGKDPDIVVQCRALKHRTEAFEEARCLTRVTCRQCGYSYTYDSSD